MAIEPATEKAPSKDFEAHVRDYSEFVRLFKYGAIASFVIGFFVILIIS